MINNQNNMYLLYGYTYSLRRHNTTNTYTVRYLYKMSWKTHYMSTLEYSYEYIYIYIYVYLIIVYCYYYYHG